VVNKFLEESEHERATRSLLAQKKVDISSHIFGSTAYFLFKSAVSVKTLLKKPDCYPKTDQMYNSFPMSKLRLCLSNIIEMSNVVFLLNSGLSPFNPSQYRIRVIYPLSFVAKASFQILCVNFSTHSYAHCAVTAPMTLNASTLPTYIVKCTICYFLFLIPT
jgi:hypothetical protein